MLPDQRLSTLPVFWKLTMRSVVERRWPTAASRQPLPVIRRIGLVPPNKEPLLGPVIRFEEVLWKLWLNVAKCRHPGMLSPLSVKITDLVELFCSPIYCFPHHPVTQLVELVVGEADRTGKPLDWALVVPRHVVTWLGAKFVESTETIPLRFWVGCAEDCKFGGCRSEQRQCPTVHDCP